MENVPDLADVRTSHQECLDLLGRIKFNQRYLGHVLPITYFASMLELTDSAIILLERDKLFDIYPIMRVIQELSVDLQNLANDEGYFRCLLLDHEQNWKKLLQQAQSGNPYLSSLREAYELNDLIAARSSEIRKIRGEGGSFLTVEEKFRRAGRIAEYKSVYRYQSMYAHTSLQSSISRHMVEIGSEIEFSMYKAPEISSKDTIRGSLDEFMKLSKAAIEEIFEVKITHPS
ncbi:MAG: DUF5677 domain-containing protein [Pseudomonadota bacterium]